MSKISQKDAILLISAIIILVAITFALDYLWTHDPAKGLPAQAGGQLAGRLVAMVK